MEINDFDEIDEADNTEQEDDFLVDRNISLRNYQITLVERARNDNTIIYLPTGSGKTLIALHVLCGRSNDIRRSYGEGGKRAFFVGITKVMVYQLYSVLRTHTKFKVVFFTGDMNVDNWNRSKWMSYFEKNHVFVLTAEILKQILQLKFIQSTNISLIVLDECHHAVADHPYRFILQYINEDGSSEKPLLLGLSSVLLNCNIKNNQTLRFIQSLENAFRGRIVTQCGSASFISNPREKIIVYQTVCCGFETVLQLYNNAIEIMNSMKANKNVSVPVEGKECKIIKKAKRIKKGLVQSKELLEELGVFGGSIAALFFIILFEKFRLLSDDPKEIQILIYARTELNKIRHILIKIIGEEESVASITFFSSPKVQHLINVLKQVKENFKEKHFSALVFVHQRSTAVVLSFLLKRLSEVDEKFNYIKPNFAVGSSVLTKEYYFSKISNEDIVKQFDSQSLNLLVATNLLEEGIDVSVCNLVISFDFPLSYRSYFQSKGRARERDSYHYLFLSEAEKNEKINVLNGFKLMEKEIFECIGRDSEYKEEKNEKNSMEDLERVCLPKKAGNIIADGIIAIKVVYRYCSKLPQDSFSFLSPISWYIETAKQKKVFVQLPVNCPLREVIEGEFKKNIKLAKRSAFLATLKKLYEMNELDEDLNPKSFKVKEEDFNDIFPNFKTENISKSLPQPGTRKRKQLYEAKYAKCLSNCLPRPGIKTYVHVIEITVAFEKPELSRKVAVYDILQMPVTFAILSLKKLFKIFQFPLFLDLGQLNCNLLVNYDEIILTESELDDIKACHFTLFKKVIRIMKCYQVFDSRNKEHSFFVVPVEKNETGRYVINWDLIRCDFCKMSNSALMRYNPTSNREEKRTFSDSFNRNYMISKESSDGLNSIDALSGRFLWEINPEENIAEPKFAMTETDYKYFVIFPNYRKMDPPQYYIVNKFCHNMSPLSPFPNNFVDFLDYYKEKYSIEITNTKQPLLRVSALYNCSNFSRPRLRKSRRAKEKIKEYEELLVPELCDVIPFDRRFWIKALLLPTILNRIQHVYCVEEFRRKIISETGLGSYELPKDREWKPLEEVKTCMDEEQREENDPLTYSRVKTSFPLSKLKDKSQGRQKIILDPERNLYEIGLCDMEFYVNSLNESDCEEESKLQEMLQEGSEVVNLMALQNISVPTLNTLNGGRNNFGPDLALLVQVCTSRSANDIVDYERLEILGDSFLKFAATIFLFRNYTENEGILSCLKGKIVGNRNLLYCGLTKGIQNIINVTDFVPLYDYNPPLFYIPERLVNDIIINNIDPAVLSRFDISLEEQFSGVLSENTFKMNEEILFDFEKCETPVHSVLPFRIIDDKTIADCVEAFIGAYLLTLGLFGAFEFLSWLGILPESKGSYSEMIQKPYSIRFFGTNDDAVILNILGEVFYSDLEDLLNYHFKNKAFLLEALTHPSYVRNRITDCYQRLELLGDAVLDFLITMHIYEKCGNLTPGQVTDIRSSLVNNITFACIMVRYELHKYLLSFSSGLNKAIANFVSFQINRNHVIDDEVLILLEGDDCMIAESVQVPKALSDLFESLAGAIYLDSGNSLETVWKVYYKLMKREIDTFTETVPKTAVRLLHEICGDKPYFETKIINEVTTVTCSVYYENREIRAHGFGANKKECKRSAAKLVLNKILSLKR